MQAVFKNSFVNGIYVMYIQPNVYDDTTFTDFGFTFKAQSTVQCKTSNINMQIWERGPFIAILLKLPCLL